VSAVITLTTAQVDKVKGTAPAPAATQHHDSPPHIVQTAELHHTNVFGVWHMNLSARHPNYPNAHILNPNGAGTSIKLILPHVRRRMQLKITDIQDERNNPLFMRYGIISEHPDFDHGFESEHMWGSSGHLTVVCTPSTAGKVLYFNHRPATDDHQHDHWFSTLQMSLR
jgi:hypothetical protein